MPPLTGLARLSWLPLLALAPGPAVAECGPARPDAAVVAAQGADAPVLDELGRRLQAYADLRARLEATLPPLGPDADPSTVHARRMELARRLRVAQGRTGEGHLFTRPIRALMRRRLARALPADDLARLRAELESEEAPRVAVRVGAAYLGSEGLVTTPPGVLSALPPLPPDLEYRFVGAHLVLRDARAGLIVDFVHDALPAGGRRR